MTNDVVRWEREPSLRRPVLIVAFEGWNDAGDAASSAARYLASTWEARRFASIDPDEFYDFTVTRPTVRLIDGLTRTIEWPANDFAAAAIPNAGRDVAFLHGIEPQMRWRAFSSAVVEVAEELGVELVVSLGALLANVAHTRPVQITGTAADQDLIDELGLIRSRYEGPTGIVGVLHDTFARAGIPSASLWAAVPHYVGTNPSPKAALALVRRCAGMLGVPVRTTDLEIAAAAYERQVSEAVAADDDIAAHVRQLEYEAEDDFGAVDDVDDAPLAADTGLGEDVERLHADIERFLRDQNP